MSSDEETSHTTVQFLLVYHHSIEHIFHIIAINPHTPTTEIEETIRELFSLDADFKMGFKYFRNDNDELTYLTLNDLIPVVLGYQGDDELCVRLTDFKSVQDVGDTEDIHHANWENDVYFGEYAKMYIHQIMIADEERCNSYRDAVMRNRAFIEGKVVLDVGCGTGLLSLFCAEAGAAKVYAVEASGVYEQASELVHHNGYGDIVEVIHGKVEDIMLPVEKVDVIISEWMGLFLLFEAMLESVIFARDKWLKDDGIMMPSEAVLYMSPVANDEFRTKIDFFKEPKYGLNMDIFVQKFKDEQTYYCQRAQEIKTDWIASDDIKELIRFDTKTVTKQEIRHFSVDFEYKNWKKDYFNCLGTWFDVLFDTPEDTVVLSTSPYSKLTHWKQDMFMLEDSYEVTSESVLKGTFTAKQSTFRRHYDVHLQIQIDGKEIRKNWMM